MILLCYQLHRDALMETFAWLEASLVPKAGWKYVSMESGEHFVIGAIITTPKLCADSWDFPLVHLIQVYSLYSWPFMHVHSVSSPLLTVYNFGRGSGAVFSGLKCNGRELSLLNCSSRISDYLYCGNAAGVQCPCKL